MHSVSVREARQHIGRLLDQVENGEVIVITRRGKPVVTMHCVQEVDAKIRFPERDEFRSKIALSRHSSVELIRSIRDERG